MQKPSILIGGEALRPQARTEDLVTRELPDEELVYDLKTHQAHCLNKSASAVWKQCDGQKTIEEIARLLQQETNELISTSLVQAALHQLSKANLLEQQAAFAVEKPNQLRREILRRMGLGAAAAIPLVTSIIAPLTAQAMSCVVTGSIGNCTAVGGNDCCSTCCNNTTNRCLETGLTKGAACQRDCQCTNSPMMQCPSATPRLCV